MSNAVGVVGCVMLLPLTVVIGCCHWPVVIDCCYWLLPMAASSLLDRWTTAMGVFLIVVVHVVGMIQYHFFFIIIFLF